MSLIFEARSSDSPLIDTVTCGHTISDGSPTRPAEINWHMVLVRHRGNTRLLLVGPWSASGVARFEAGAEILWLRFSLGTFMPHLPARRLLDSETVLPGAASKSFWLKGSAWQFPSYENVETFVNRLVREDVLAFDPLVSAVLEQRLSPQELAARTVRHRFLQATGLPQNHIRQVQRAQHAAALLRQGMSILDTVHEAGYFDQPHLTRSLRQFIGYTPAQLLQESRPQHCHSVQDEAVTLRV